MAARSPSINIDRTESPISPLSNGLGVLGISATTPSTSTPSPYSSPSLNPGSPIPAPSHHLRDDEQILENKLRRKRSRVNPQQLAVLESIFAADRNPSPARRKEISGQLEMNERQTQVWFQNRRAKAKQAEGGRATPKTVGRPVSPKTSTLPPQNPHCPARDVVLQKMIREDDAVIIIPCTELSIGSWTRVASSNDAQRHDLLAYVCEAQQRLTWFVHYASPDGEHAVKMDIPLDSVLDMQLAHTASDAARASLFLSATPSFWMSAAGEDASAGWVSCGDWTEQEQATRVLRHELTGAPAPLTYLWTRIQAYLQRDASQASGSPYSDSAQALLSPSEQDSRSFATSSPGFQLQQPPSTRQQLQQPQQTYTSMTRPIHPQLLYNNSSFNNVYAPPPDVSAHASDANDGIRLPSLPDISSMNTLNTPFTRHPSAPPDGRSQSHSLNTLFEDSSMGPDIINSTFPAYSDAYMREDLSVSPPFAFSYPPATTEHDAQAARLLNHQQMQPRLRARASMGTLAPSLARWSFGSAPDLRGVGGPVPAGQYYTEQAQWEEQAQGDQAGGVRAVQPVQIPYAGEWQSSQPTVVQFGADGNGIGMVVQEPTFDPGLWSAPS